MPRPGPRPYECVRRAWHSERHQPMRGSLIKEIFRIAHEIHSPITKKNKEWQEKLPIVVLKAEEIMYSKANSEPEYMDLKTLWERVNDAIDTIIRRDESVETGELLQPCIEAALNLGCIPRRASRSERNSNPRFYLGAYSLDRGNETFKPTSALTSQYPNFLNPATLSSKLPGKDPQKCDFHVLNGELNAMPPPVSLQCSTYSAYPLYYGTYPPSESQPSFTALPTTTPKPSFVNDKNIMETGIMQKTSPFDKESCTTITEEDHPEELVCDLSLRLAPLSVSAPWTNHAPCNLPHVPEYDVRSNVSSREDAKLNDFAMDKHKGLPLCTWDNSVPTLGLSSSMMESQAGHLNADLTTRKRRAAETADEQQFSWQPKLLCGYSAGSARIAGL